MRIQGIVLVIFLVLALIQRAGLQVEVALVWLMASVWLEKPDHPMFLGLVFVGGVIYDLLFVYGLASTSLVLMLASLALVFVRQKFGEVSLVIVGVLGGLAELFINLAHGQGLRFWEVATTGISVMLVYMILRGVDWHKKGVAVRYQ